MYACFLAEVGWDYRNRAEISEGVSVFEKGHYWSSRTKGNKNHYITFLFPVL